MLGQSARETGVRRAYRLAARRHIQAATGAVALFYLCQRARRIRLQGVLPHALILALARRHIDWLQLCRQMLRPQIV